MPALLVESVRVGGLEALIKSEEFWSSFGYLILVTGLIGDIVVLVVPRHRERLEKLLTAFFTIVIIVGVAIEHRADSALSVLVSQEERANNLKIAKLATDLAMAQGDAAVARKRAEALRLDIARANERAAEANQRTEKERLARVQLEAAIVPRSLSANEVEEIADASRRFAKPDIKVLIQTSQGDGLLLGLQIDAALSKAGFDVQLRDTKQVWYGFYFGGPTDHWENVLGVAKAVGKCLGKPSIIDSLPPGSPITINVGERLERFMHPLPK
jgi:hypothetical protein